MKKTRYKLLILAILSLSTSPFTLTGCYSPGLPTTPSNTESGPIQLSYQDQSTLNRLLLAGKTTKQDVVALFGEPQNGANAADGSIMAYAYKKETYGFMYHSTNKLLTLYFDPSGILKNFTFQEFSV